ncbi:YciE/YciF ferroxidase family protein [Halocatena pleomorpha]|uniref:DUF892 family protein n=1 Tax=Halocatena pleomorpha TaxID=1785090 RepID=A0A3P3RK37_9EURY|nr:DUF892 family protein [Halocatena pleomorpha]RRJ33782.1 DUF892 family protein [Halocatena pleomorpha]
MTANQLDEMFEDGLKNIYYTEQQLVDTLSELEQQTAEDTLREAFSEHRSETEEHVHRLEEVFGMMDMEPEGKPDRAVEGLIEDHDEFASRDPEQQVLDRFNLSAGQKTEHYEIGAYDTLIPTASDLGMDEAADLLEQSRQEEENALNKLSDISRETRSPE